jgi:hypothetical protein
MVTLRAAGTTTPTTTTTAPATTTTTRAPATTTTTTAPPATTTTTTPGGGGTGFPRAASSNGRYLVDQNGAPWMMVGDSNQCTSAALSVADMDFLFANRQSHGFNADWVNLICTTYTGGRSDYSTYDGIKPFSNPMDVSTINEAYFARMDQMVQSALSHGITLVLDPLETGAGGDTLVNSGPTKTRNYGVFLGNRYKSYPNIIWMSGNDYGDWSRVDPAATALAQGLRSADPNHVQTVELNPQVSDSFDNPNWPPLINLNASYTYFPTYAEVLKSYNRPGPMPVFMVEANYEGENNTGGPTTTDETMRRQEYWTMTSGATGQLYGHRMTWGFQFGPWKSSLDTPAVTQLTYMKQLFAARAWYNLVPDQTHRFLTAGAGTFDSGTVDVLQSDYATAAVTPDGSFGVAYVPTQRTITIDMTKMRGATTARWFDPTNNTYRAIAGSPLPNTGTRQFATPGANGGGLGDWVLVLEA